jgi:hypothetical protein
MSTVVDVMLQERLITLKCDWILRATEKTIVICLNNGYNLKYLFRFLDLSSVLSFLVHPSCFRLSIPVQTCFTFIRERKFRKAHKLALTTNTKHSQQH